MNRKYLGDALDHWKGSLFESLQQRNALRDFAVDTMATDMNDWQPEDINVFARLLRIRVSQIIRHTVTLEARRRYFAEIEHSGDLFFDPDTGIQTGPVKNPTQYIQPGEIMHFLKNHERIVAIYQHVRAQAVSGRVDAVCRTLSAVDACKWCSYESGTVAMMFFSKSDDRLVAVVKHFREMLGSHANGRIRQS